MTAALVDATAELCAALMNFAEAVSGGAAAPAKVSSKRVDPVEADVDEETGVVSLDRDEVESLGIVALRKLAKDNGIDAKKKSDILDAFEEGGFFSGAVDDDELEVDDDDEDEADGDDDEEYTRADLEEMDLRELKRIAKEEGNSQADIKGLDQEGLIDLILGEEADEDEDEEDEDDEDEDEADEDDEDEDEEEDDDDEEEVVIDKETLDGMSDAELKNIVKQFSIKLPRGAKRKTIIQTILDAAEDADDDE